MLLELHSLQSTRPLAIEQDAMYWESVPVHELIEMANDSWPKAIEKVAVPLTTMVLTKA